MKNNRRKSEYKQLAFDTAIRNPERYKEILTFMKQYEGCILDDENLLEIVTNMYLEGIVSSKGFSIADYSTKDEQKKAVSIVNKTRNSDGGFPKGYQSRFWTYMRTPSEFGLVYARYNEKFCLGKVARKLVNEEIDAQEAFSLQACKYNRRSPYKNVLNDYNYFTFIINVLKALELKNKKMSYNQFVVSLFSENGDVDEFVDLLEQNRFADSNRTYDFIKRKYQKVNKYKTVMKDYPDVVLRMLRITGFVNIEYNGILLIECNKENEEYINKLFELEFSINEEEKNDARLYFNRLENITDEELSIIRSNKKDLVAISNYNEILSSIISKYKLTEKKIILGINDACNNRRGDIRFKYLSDPLKLEFYISLFVFFKYGDIYNIKPNYKIDANGIPISHAPGNIGDIEITGGNIYWLLEVTLIRNKTQQLNNETVNLFRHLNTNVRGVKYLSLIAPKIHEDTEMIYKATTISLLADGIGKLYAKPYDMKDFIDIISRKKTLSDMEQYTDNLKLSMLDALK